MQLLNDVINVTTGYATIWYFHIRTRSMSREYGHVHFFLKKTPSSSNNKNEFYVIHDLNQLQNCVDVVVSGRISRLVHK